MFKGKYCKYQRLSKHPNTHLIKLLTDYLPEYEPLYVGLIIAMTRGNSSTHRRDMGVCRMKDIFLDKVTEFWVRIFNLTFGHLQQNEAFRMFCDVSNSN